MKAMTKQMIDYCANAGINYSVRDVDFTILIAGEEYTIRRMGLRSWKCVHNGVVTVFKSQLEVISWLDSRW